MRNKAKPMVVRGLELLKQVQRDERELVVSIREAGAKYRTLRSHLEAWRKVLAGSGPARRARRCGRCGGPASWCMV